MTDTNLAHAVPVQFGNETVQAIPQGDGTYLQIGNTNGNPANPYTWLTWAIMNGKAKASPAWGASGQLHSWYSNQHYGASFFNHWMPILIQATTEVGVAYGFAAADIGAAGGGGGAAAGADAPQVAFTGELAQPVVAVDTGLTAATIAPISISGAVATGSLVSGAATALSTAAKVVSTVAAAKSVAAQVNAGTVKSLPSPAAPAPGAGKAPAKSSNAGWWAGGLGLAALILWEFAT